MNCTEKFIKHSERVGARFAEQNAGTSQIIHYPFNPEKKRWTSEVLNAQNQS